MAMIPAAFEARKWKILEDLSVPDAEYTDLSPKGSVDEGIRDLIHDINALDGLVTTSSCAGRVSVYLEGRRKREESRRSQPIVSCATTEMSTGDRADDAPFANVAARPPRNRKFASSGGKGAGGCWLYVSHDPVSLGKGEKTASLHELFGVSPGLEKPVEGIAAAKQSMRLVRFRFEPMVR
jgi:tRNA wybutosine-synthesizing protein 3